MSRSRSLTWGTSRRIGRRGQLANPQTLRYRSPGFSWGSRRRSGSQRSLLFCNLFLLSIPRWAAADAEIKVPSGENTELKRSPFKAWSRSVYSHTCHAYCQGFLPSCPLACIFFQNLSRVFLWWLWLTHSSCVGPQSKIGHPARGKFPCWVPADYK